MSSASVTALSRTTLPSTRTAPSEVDASETPPSRGATLPATHSPVWHTSPLGQRRVSGPVSQASRHWPARQYIPVGHVTPLQSSVTQ